MNNTVCQTRRFLLGERGWATVELALVLPFLLLLTFGAIEFSVALYDKSVIASACREGARSAIVYKQNPDDGPALDNDVKQAVRDYCEDRLLNWNPEGEDPTVTIDRTGYASGDQVSVSIEYKYHFLMLPSFVGSLAGGLDLNATTVMRQE